MESKLYSAPAAVRGAPDHGPAVLAGFLGWTLDAFDFFLLVFALAPGGNDFGRSVPAIALTLPLSLASARSARSSSASWPTATGGGGR